jgi:hypothetical protein
MIAAIYARKSTEQHGVSDDAKSVTRQVDHARLFAKRKGWRTDEALILSTTACRARSSRTGPALFD